MFFPLLANMRGGRVRAFVFFPTHPIPRGVLSGPEGGQVVSVRNNRDSPQPRLLLGVAGTIDGGPTQNCAA